MVAREVEPSEFNVIMCFTHGNKATYKQIAVGRSCSKIERIPIASLP